MGLGGFPRHKVVAAFPAIDPMHCFHNGCCPAAVGGEKRLTCPSCHTIDGHQSQVEDPFYHSPENPGYILQEQTP